VQSGDFEFTLTRLRSGDAAPEGLATVRTAVAPWTSAEFVVAGRGQTQPTWRLRRFEGVSAAGNSFTVPAPQVWRSDNAIVTGTYHVLWPEDGAWRVRAEFSQESRLPPNQTWIFRKVPLQAGSPTVLSNLNVTVHGITLTNLEVLLLHSSQLQPGLAPRNVQVKLGFAPSPPGVRVDLIEAADESGRPLEFNPGYDFPPGAYSTRLRTPDGAQTVDLSFAVRPSHIVEFLVTPEFVLSETSSTFPKAGRTATNTAR
jgi:hypothetical protein